MPRSAVDATRFTSTAPYASTKPQSAKNRSPVAVFARQHRLTDETAEQKVQRLRAAAHRARDAHLTMFDKLIIRGRVWADVAHRFTTWSLIGATVVAGAVTVYAVGDMVIYNRRKRAEFFTAQKIQDAVATKDAQLALEGGSVSQVQLEMIKRAEDEQNRLEQLKRRESLRDGILTRSKKWLFSGLKREEDGEGSRSSDRGLVYGGLSGDEEVGGGQTNISKVFERKIGPDSGESRGVLMDANEQQRLAGKSD